MNYYYLVGGLIIFIIDIAAIDSVFDTDIDPEFKVLWSVLILILPILGAFIWFVMKPKKPTKFFSEPNDLL